jgi:hypothetical protein
VTPGETSLFRYNNFTDQLPKSGNKYIQLRGQSLRVAEGYVAISAPEYKIASFDSHDNFPYRDLGPVIFLTSVKCTD